MCGITGFYRLREDLPPVSLDSLRKMNGALDHRGPDDEGYHYTGQVGLGHRRLSILDLSPRARQPMTDGEGRFFITYNGEIYNFREIRRELDKYEFRTTSDTEVILYAYREWGEECLSRFVGMFSFAIWDEDSKSLFLARDRLGIKPLYYYFDGGHFVFASELKSIFRYPFFKRELDLQSLYEYFVFQYVPEPRTIFKNTHKLLPGNHLTVRKGNLEQRCYWDIPEGERGETGEREALEHFEALLSESIRLRQVSDVPIGAFLSGGIDSSTVVAILQAQNSSPVMTFSIGFREASYDEAPYARQVAEYLGTEHNELYVTPKEAFDVVPLLPRVYDEPFSDSSAIPTFLVSKMAREKVKVCLSGDGGDELFCGYNRYAVANQMKVIRSIPLHREILSVLAKMPRGFLEVWGRVAKRLLFSDLKVAVTAEKIKKVAEASKSESVDFYLGLVKIFSEEEARGFLGKRDLSLSETQFHSLNRALQRVAEPERFSFLDMKTYLPGDILTKVDRASMAHGLEVRVPFLDHRMVEWAVRLPYSLKCRGKEAKYLLKKLLSSKIPGELFRRPKQGFGIPISSWLRNELKYLIDAYLDRERIVREGLLDADLIEKLVRSHMEGQEDHGYRLYNVLMFQMWKEHWGM